LVCMVNVSIDWKLVIVIHILRLRPFVINFHYVHNLSSDLFMLLAWSFLGLGEIFKLDLLLRRGRWNGSLNSCTMCLNNNIELILRPQCTLGPLQRETRWPELPGLTRLMFELWLVTS
jgi:hypothetical protein